MSTDSERIIKKIPELDVLVFAPHPDDAELFCGGTVALLSESYKVGIIDLTRGESSSRGTPETREKESAAAAGVLSLHFRGNLEIPDTCIFKNSPMSQEEQLKRVSLAIRKSRPSLVLAPYGENRHPDHENSRKLVQESLFMASLKNRFPGYEPHIIPMVIYYMCRTAFTPSIVIDVSNSYSGKLSAIQCFHSQIAHNSSEPETLVSHPLSVQSIVSRDSFYGSMIGVEKGEPFYLDGPLPVKDPMQYLSSTGPLRRFISS